MKAETKVHTSHSAYASLHYIYFGHYQRGRGKLNQPHPNENGVTVRNYMISGIACRTDTFQHALNDFDYFLNQRQHNKVQCTCVILSFRKSAFDFGKRNDIIKAVDFGRNFAKTAFPHHQAVIAAQNDNTNANPHLHVIVNQINTRTLHSIPSSKYNVYRLRRIADRLGSQFERQYGIQLSRAKPDQYHINAYESKLIHILTLIINNEQVTSKQAFRNQARQLGMRASFHTAGRHRKNKRRNRKYVRGGLTVKLPGHNYMKSSTLAKYQPKIAYKNVIKQIHLNRQRKKEADKDAKIKQRRNKKTNQKQRKFNAIEHQINISKRRTTSESTRTARQSGRVPQTIQTFHEAVNGIPQAQRRAKANQNKANALQRTTDQISEFFHKITQQMLSAMQSVEETVQRKLKQIQRFRKQRKQRKIAKQTNIIRKHNQAHEFRKLKRHLRQDQRQKDDHGPEL